ncbi:MAG TPA: DNA recombination protein RmuC [Dehalococcoidia bacterium]|nr:DNA recombination protein RmuC [Dehalococcoidia bacterium]
MEIAIIVLLVVLVGFFAWDRLRGRQRWKEQGETLSKIVEEKVAGSVGVFGDLRERLGELTKRTKDIEEASKSISSLQEALRAPKFRGEFGEVGLETLLMNHFSGSYHLQYRFQNGKIVDAVLRIGENLVPIDAKFPFPLEDFERMVTTQSQEEQIRLRRQFTRTIKKHIDDVSQYIQPDEGTFDFALLYIPAENLYYETVVRGSQPSQESDIYSYCRQKRVFIVSPNTFYAYLQAIVLGLNGLQVEKFAREIVGQLERLKGELQDFQEDYELIGRHISNAAKKHTEAETKLTRLSGRLELLKGETRVEELPQGDTQTGNEDK